MRVQDDLNLLAMRMFEGVFSLDAAHFIINTGINVAGKNVSARSIGIRILWHFLYKLGTFVGKPDFSE